jgi:hypothetical protein
MGSVCEVYEKQISCQLLAVIKTLNLKPGIESLRLGAFARDLFSRKAAEPQRISPK